LLSTDNILDELWDKCEFELKFSNLNLNLINKNKKEFLISRWDSHDKIFSPIPSCNNSIIFLIGIVRSLIIELNTNSSENHILCLDDIGGDFDKKYVVIISIY